MTLLTQDNTYLSVGLVIALAGGIVWLTKLHLLAKSNERNIKDMDSRMKSLELNSSQVNVRMERIETKLDFIIEELKSQHNK